MDIQAYLDRIGYRGSVRPTVAVLRKLHRQHLLSVPFENLDIHLGRPIILDELSFYNKIVTEKRGGYCYELNGCFAWLLGNLGFKVRMLSARVAGKKGSFSPEFDHMVLLVSLRERWLVDVGFGDLFTEPLLLDSTASQKDDGQLFQIRKKNGARILSRWNEESGSWKSQYSFHLRPRSLSDFAARNRYQQTSARSHFTQGLLISKLTTSGRTTLTGRKVIVTQDQKRNEYRVKNKGEFRRLLARHFRLRLGTSGVLV